MNHLRKDGKWNVPPKEAIRWGQSLGLICTSYTTGQFVFPLARVLSFMKPGNIDIVTRLLTDLCEKQIWKLSLNKFLKESLKKGFSKFKNEISYIVRRREALLTGKKVTLQELGYYFNLTRERIRQLEDKFLNLLYLHDSYREPFLIAMLCDFMANSGSLIVDINSHKAPLRRFLAKCSGIPQLEFPKIELVALATRSSDIKYLKSSNSLPDEINPDFIAARLESKISISFSGEDVRKLAKKTALFRQKQLTKAQRVYLTLRAIGRPAHYSKIAEVYNYLYPEHAMSEHNVHAILSHQKYGVVWIGVKGTYALKEWGYERPSKTLFETVTEIVRRRYENAGVPVPINVIISEIGKYRKVVKPSSIAIATHCNPGLKQVSKNTFIPRESDDHVQDEISLDKLDKIFKEFEEN
jgi:hypothetical protein